MLPIADMKRSRSVLSYSRHRHIHVCRSRPLDLPRRARAAKTFYSLPPYAVGWERRNEYGDLVDEEQEERQRIDNALYDMNDLGHTQGEIDS